MSRRRPATLVTLLGLSALWLTGLGLPAGSLAATRALQFDVFLDGRPIGTQRFEVENGASGAVRVTSRAEFEVRVLRIKLFEYDHRNVEEWQDGCLRRLDAYTDSNGKRQQVQGRAVGGEFRVRDPSTGTERPLAPCVGSFAYWDRSRLAQHQRLLNPQTGAYVPVTLSDLDEVSLSVAERPRRVRRYALRGEGIDIVLGYDSTTDEWLTLDGRVDGRELSYRPVGAMP